jgi:hypothetical protein
MQQTATPSAASPSFAGLMASLATPASTAAQRAPVWNDDELADDVATLSYERALRAHGRYQRAVPADLTDRSLLQSAEPGPIHGGEEHRADRSSVGPEATPQSSQYSSADLQAKGKLDLSTALGGDLKCASITMRMSKVESAQLRQRAAEAGLTISAYLRSCTFEAESLRAQVKEALAQLRSAPFSPDHSDAQKIALDRARRSWLEWLWAILPPWHSRQRAVRA